MVKRDGEEVLISAKNCWGMVTYMQKAGDCGDISPQFFFGFSAKF